MLTTRLKVNFNKSRVFGIGAMEGKTSNWANILGCEVGTFPFKYLGVLVGANMKTKKHWKIIIERFNSKLSTWKSKTISFSGWLTLLKSVLGNLPTYFFSLFIAPVAVTDALEKIRRNFLWGVEYVKRKIHWVSWHKIVASKTNGGLGVGSIRALNIILISLWCKVITCIHNLHNKPHDQIANKHLNGVWNNITSVRKDLIKHGMDVDDIFKLHVKSRGNTKFWYDK
uniref:Reverse transcriptase zinc-binding domain-containing protein n=1 Tax=Lactuca sativa TaxID=4236 RepID=A0A9R1VSM1_LACSA|nr:hypothetical protein LSAT_V11C400178610 [Lactuca sativa]